MCYIRIEIVQISSEIDSGYYKQISTINNIKEEME